MCVYIHIHAYIIYTTHMYTFIYVYIKIYTFKKNFKLLNNIIHMFSSRKSEHMGDRFIN